MVKKRNKKPWLGGSLQVKATSQITGEVTEEEFDLCSLTVPELRKKMKDIYGVDLSRADAKRLLAGGTVKIPDVLNPFSTDTDA